MVKGSHITLHTASPAMLLLWFLTVPRNFGLLEGLKKGEGPLPPLNMHLGNAV